MARARIILLGTGMGDASRHSNANLPTLVAGGGFKHGSHIAIDGKKPDAPLLGPRCNSGLRRCVSGFRVYKFALFSLLNVKRVDVLLTTVSRRGWNCS